MKGPPVMAARPGLEPATSVCNPPERQGSGELRLASFWIPPLPRREQIRERPGTHRGAPSLGFATPPRSPEPRVESHPR